MLKQWFIPSVGQQRQVGVLVFGILGAGLLFFGIALWLAVSLYTASATRAEAVVDAQRSAEGWPVLRYHNGTQEILFVQPPVLFVGSGMKEGDRVNILYDPANPSATRIDSFAALWLTPLQSVLAGAFLLVIAFHKWLLVYTPVFLAKHGHEVEAEVSRISTRISLLDKGRIWQVHAEWKDPNTQRLHEFTSLPLKRPPGDAVAVGERVMVRFNPHRISMHLMDIEPLLSRKKDSASCAPETEAQKNT